MAGLEPTISESKSGVLPLHYIPSPVYERTGGRWPPASFKWGGIWGSNPRHPEPQSGALPTELIPPYRPRRLKRGMISCCQIKPCVLALAMARQEGFEPPTYCLEGSCSILLSYWRIYVLPAQLPDYTELKPNEAVFYSEKEEGDRGCAALRGFFQKTREAERSKLLPTMERVMGIEPTYPAWKAGVLPLNYTRRGAQSTFSLEIIPQAPPECQSFFLFFPSRTLDSFLIWKRIQKNLYKCYKYSIIF